MSKFVIMPGPQFYPGKTICCGKTSGPVVDFGVVEEFGPRDGAVYFCVDCIVEAALQTHLVILKTSVSSGVLSADEVREMRDNVGRLHALFANGLSDADRLRSLTSLLDSVVIDQEDAGHDPNAITIPDFPSLNGDELIISEGPAGVSANSSDDKSVPAFGL